MIEVFTPAHMFYKSAEGEHLLSAPFFLIMLGRVMEHIAIDQYSPSDTHARFTKTPQNAYTQTHVGINTRINTHSDTHLHMRWRLLAHFPGCEMISMSLTAVSLPRTPPHRDIGAVG